MEPMRAREIAARWSVGVGVVILLCKVTAWLVTGSLAVMADALESVVHVGATLVMYWALRVSTRPPDPEHPFGHGKVGSFSVGFEGGLVAGSGLLVWWMVVDRLIAPQAPGALAQGALWVGAAAAVNLVLGLYLLRVAHRTRSVILRADAHHVLADVWTSGAALLGLGLLAATGLAWIDLVIAALAGVHLLWIGVRLVREAGAELIDSADRDTLAEVVAVLNRERGDDWLDVHRLRVHSVGERRYVEFHLVVPGAWTVRRAHDLIERLEAAILSRLGAEGAVNVHLDYPRGEDGDPDPDRDFTVSRATRLRMADGVDAGLSAGDRPVDQPRL